MMSSSCVIKVKELWSFWGAVGLFLCFEIK